MFMVYDWIERQRRLLQPIAFWAAQTADPWLSGAMLSWRDLLLALAGFDALGGETQRTGAGVPLAAAPVHASLPLAGAAAEVPFAIEAVEVDGMTATVVERTVLDSPFCRLLGLERRLPARARTAAPASGQPSVRQPKLSDARLPRAVLLCAPLAGHHAVMLRETAETLLCDANVYVTDWANARDVPLAAGRFGLDEHVMLIERFIHALSRTELHVVAVCQATVPALGAVALLAASGAQTPRTLTLIGGPIDAHLHPTGVGRFAQAHSLRWFSDTVVDAVPPHFAGAGRRVYPGFLQHAALLTAHPHRYTALRAAYFTSLLTGDRAGAGRALRSLREYASVLDMDERYFLDMIDIVFQRSGLARGTWQVRGRTVRPQQVTDTAVLTIEGDLDDITGAGQTHAALALCSALPQHATRALTIALCNHYDLFSGPRWQQVVHREVSDWIAAHAAPVCAAPPSFGTCGPNPEPLVHPTAARARHAFDPTHRSST
jgi:polyhydroxyalkanoate depolymerase